MELIQLLATLGLLAVTAWYAKTTKNMANTARDAARDSARAIEAAERSAESARDAAWVAQSRVDVEFTGRQIGLFTQGDHVPTVEIRSTADPVVIQRVRVRRAFRVNPDGELHDEPGLVDADLTAVGEMTLPRRLHTGERLHLTHPAMADQHEDAFGRFLLDVEYTFNEEGGTGATKQLIISEKMT